MKKFAKNKGKNTVKDDADYNKIKKRKRLRIKCDTKQKAIAFIDLRSDKLYYSMSRRKLNPLDPLAWDLFVLVEPNILGFHRTENSVELQKKQKTN